MKTINEGDEPLRQLFQDFDDFEANRDLAIDAAIKGDRVEIWTNGDYFTLEYHSLQADASH